MGFGAIGKAVARLLTGFGCTVLYTKPHRLGRDEEKRLGVVYAELPDLLARSDVVALHCPLTPATTRLIDRGALESMKPTAVLVNVARGGVVAERDLAWALRNRVIHAAAVDVYEVEPLPAASPLRHIDNLTLTPHLGAMAADTFEPTVGRMFENITPRLSRGAASGARRSGALTRPFPAGSRRRARIPPRWRYLRTPASREMWVKVRLDRTRADPRLSPASADSRPRTPYRLHRPCAGRCSRSRVRQVESNRIGLTSFAAAGPVAHRIGACTPARRAGSSTHHNHTGGVTR